MAELNYNKRNSFVRGGQIMADSKIDDDMNVNAMSPEKYDKSHRVLFTQEIGRILPVTAIPVNAGDDFKGSITNYGLFNPMIAPIMDNLVTKMHAFFIPNRIINPNWELFYTRGINGTYFRNLPMIVWTNITSASVAEQKKYLEGLAMLVWSIGHNMTPQQVYDWIHSNSDLVETRTKRILDNAFGKGSMLDMLNLGFANFWHNRTGVYVHQFPEITPTAPLLAYQFIWNEFYRVENYFTDMFYQPEFANIWDNFNARVSLSTFNFPAINIPLGWMYQHMFDGALPYKPASANASYRYDDDTFFFTPRTSDVTYDSNGVPTMANGVTLMIAWLLSMRGVPAEKDYLTTILPNTQRGDVASIGLSGQLPLLASVPPQAQNGMAVPYFKFQSTHGAYENEPVNQAIVLGSKGFNNAPVEYWKTQDQSSPTSWYVDGSGASFTADDIRNLFAKARFLERNNVAGYTMPQQLLAKLGIDVGFYDMLKPRYLGGLKCVPDVSKVMQTTPNEQGYVGDYAGEASQFANGDWECRCDDFGYIIVLCSTAPENSYSHFIDRTHFQTKDVSTFPDPSFARLSEQHLYANEFNGKATVAFFNWVNGLTAPTDADVVGYVPRYNHYRKMVSTVHGEFVPNIGTLDYFTTARDFSDAGDGLSLTPQDIMYHSVEDPQCNRFMQVKQDEFPSINMECRFGISVLSRLPRIELPVTL